MKISMEKTSDVAFVDLDADHLDAGNANQFKQEIAPVLQQNRKVVLNIGKLQFVDSSGLGALLSCLRQTNAAGGDLRLCEPTKPVRALFELVRMHRVFEIFNSRGEAEASFR